MKRIKRLVALIMSIVMVMCSTLPSLASANDVIESTTESKIAEQLKNDLGVEKAEKILGKSSLDNDDDLYLSASNDELFDESNEVLFESKESLNEHSQAEKTYNSNYDLVDDLVYNEFEQESEENIDIIEDKVEQDNVVASTEEYLEENNNLNNIESSVDDTNSDDEENESTNAVSKESVERDASTENSDAGTTESQNSVEEDIIAKELEVNNLLDNLEGLVATISDIEENIAFDSEILFGVGGQVHYLNNLWYDENLTNITKENVDFIRFVNDGHEPVHTAVYDLDNSGLKLYVYESHRGREGVEVTVYIFIPEGDTLDADENASYMFSFAEAGGPSDYTSSLRGIFNLELLNTSNVTDMSYMFAGNRNCAYCDVSSFNTSNVTNMSHMFEYCNTPLVGGSLTTGNNYDVSNFDTSNVTDMSYMFYQGRTNYNSMLTNLDVSNFNTHNVTNMSNMFNGCSQLTNLDISGFDTSNVTDMTYMFGGCNNITSLDLSGFNTANVWSMYGMFWSCTNLQSVDVSSFNMENVSDIRNMFYGCSQLVSLDLTSFVNMDYYVDMVSLFENCSNLITIYVVEDFYNNYANVSEQYNNTMFEGCASLIGGNGTHYSDEHKYAEYARIDTAGTPGYFTLGGGHILSSISVNLPPTTTRYIKGTNFDPTGLKINLNYSDSTTETVTYSTTTSTNFTFNGVSTLALNAIGNPFEITIGYAGKTCVQNVIVAELNGIAITTHATKLNYNAGDTFDPTGLVITLTYSDSVTQPITYNTTTSSDFTFSPTGALTRTGNVITIQYKTFSTMTMEETLNVKELTSIAVTTNPAKLSYASGQSLDPNGLVLTLTYTDSNNVTSSNTVTYNSTTQNKFSFNPSGVLTSSGNITITYDGKIGTNLNPTFAITVYQIASISVVNRPSTTSYNVGSKLNPNGLVIKVNKVGEASENIAYSSGNSSDFTFNPSLSTNLNTGHTNVTVTYGGKSTTFEISVTQSSSGYVPSGGGGSTGGGGGGGGIPTGNNPLNNTPTTTQVAANKSISATISGDTSSWVADPISGKWKLNVTLGDGQVAPASNGFYLLTNTITEVINGIIVPKQVNNTYYFDVQGNMVTGWVQTADSKWYFFDNAKTAEEGKMSIGWKQVQGSWYYFTLDGSMMASGITPDGFIIGADGKWVQ